MFDLIIRCGFYLIFFLVPLVFYSDSFELFEYNKMMLTYGLTIIIITTWILKMIAAQKLILKKTPLDLPILLFLISQILSTIFSIDRHTSIWGYYTRSNGGLLSTICYILLYYAFVSNFNNFKKQVLTMLKFSIASVFIISIWGILEHFGYSFSCLIMRGDFSDGCWVQDVQARVFATLGQPNWMAALLEMIIFPTIYFFLRAKNWLWKAVYLLAAIANYLGFTFTYSRGAMLGLLGGLVVFLVLYFWILFREKGSSKFLMPQFLALLIGSFILINLLFGSALTDFKLLNAVAVPNRPAIISGNSQLENGGTESGRIRLIVWRGALDIFMHYPLLGSGVETFAYSYYNFRPAAHNMTSEWDFLYNKAHNEYLNYLSTTGIVGFITYMAIILGFLYCLMLIIFRLKLKDSLEEQDIRLFDLAILTGYLSYLIQNFFQFSVVPIATLFFLFPAFIFIYLSDAELKFPILQNLNLKLYQLMNTFFPAVRRFFGKLAVYQSFFSAWLILMGVILLFVLVRFWFADKSFARGTKELEAGEAGQAFFDLKDAVDANPVEPYYVSQYGLAAAASSVGIQSQDATLSAQLRDQAIQYTTEALKRSPRNVPFWKTAYQTFSELALTDPKYNQNALQVLDELAILSPTDPESYFEKGQIYQSIGKANLAIQNFQTALKMKPDYQNALNSLADEYEKTGQKKAVIETIKQEIKYHPDDTDAAQKLKDYQLGK